eukprot:671488-Pyramimonas_sp.AAC.1
MTRPSLREAQISVLYNVTDMTSMRAGQGRIPPSYFATRASRGRSTEGVVEMSVDVSPSGIPIGNREQAPD